MARATCGLDGAKCHGHSLAVAQSLDQMSDMIDHVSASSSARFDHLAVRSVKSGRMLSGANEADLTRALSLLQEADQLLAAVLERHGASQGGGKSTGYQIDEPNLHEPKGLARSNGFSGAKRWLLRPTVR